MFYALQEDESTPEIEKFIEGSVLKWREFVYELGLTSFFCSQKPCSL
jgi:hypothetical protein